MQREEQGSPLDRLRLAISNSREPQLIPALLAIESLGAAECKAALHLLAVAAPASRETLQRAVAERWASLDPHEAFAHSARQPNGDLRAALGSAAGVKLAALNPETALEYITNANGEEKFRNAHLLLPAVARVNPARAAEYLESTPQLAGRDALYRMVAQEYALVSPVDALSWTASIPHKGLRDEATRHAWSSWARHDPAAAARMADSGVGSGAPSYVFEDIASSWSRTDLAGAIQWVDSLPEGDNQKSAARRLNASMEILDSSQASALLASATSPAARTALTPQLAAALARSDPAAAISWVQFLPEGPDRSQALRPAFEQWANTDPAAAAQYANQLTDAKQRSDLLKRAIERWTNDDPMAVTQFAQQLPAGKERDTALALGIRGLAQTDHQQALALFKTLQDPEMIGRAAGELMQTVAKQDGAAALTLAQQMPADAPPQAYQSLVRGWAFDHMTDAGQWINNLESGPRKDAAIKAYVSVIDGVDAGLATKWATSIQDPTERTQAVFGAFERWSREAPQAAQQWLDTTTVPEGLRPFFDKALSQRKN